MSALVDKVYTLGNLMTFDSNGLSIASFVDIKRTLINRKRELYGVDIDVSDASADGQWITEIALLINNTFQCFNALYADLNPATAQGKALDLLASFSNISRKPAMASICEVTLTMSANQSYDMPVDARFIDKNGNIWQIDDDRLEYLPPETNNVYHCENGQCVPLICEITGPISIPANSILGFININSSNSNVTVSQPAAGIQGSIAESDVHLRARRNRSAANEAITVIDGIQGALLANTNIIDAYIINHTVAEPSPANIAAHTVEVILHSRIDTTAMRTFIANTIYDRLTPGIPTSYDAYTTQWNELQTFRENLSTDIVTYKKIVQWVEAIPIMPKIKINLHMLANCDMQTAAKNIIGFVANYANNLGLLVDLNAASILQEIIFADPKFQGRSTYYCTPNDITLDATSAPFTYKPSEATGADGMPEARDVSAAVRKTYYSYDDTMTKVSDTSYRNADSSIELIFVS